MSISESCVGCTNYNRAKASGTELFCKLIIDNFLILELDRDRCPCRSCLIKMTCRQPCKKYNDPNLRKRI
jgi:hypothetical protein